MTDWLINLPVVWMTVVMLALTYLATALMYTVVTRLAVGERARAFKAVSAGMLSPLAVLFALLVGFLAAQVWTDADRSRTAVNQEASALRSVVMLAAAFPGEPETQLRGLVRQHIQNAVTTEWPAMASRSATLTLTSPPLTDALRETLALDTKTPGQATAQREIVVSLEDALSARRQRIILSQSVVNWVKWTALICEAALTLLTIALVHSDNRAANRIIMTIYATASGIAFILIASHSRPFTGEISTRPTVLMQVMPDSVSAPNGP